MKKIFLAFMVSFLMACTSKTEVAHKNVPLDIKTVEDYKTKVYTGKTTATKVSEPPVNMPLNASDSHPRPSNQGVPPIVLMPSIGYHYGNYGYHRYHHYYR